MFEVPSNILLHRYGARVWIARIMVTWGIIAGAMGFLQTPVHFVSLRVLLVLTASLLGLFRRSFYRPSRLTELPHPPGASLWA